MPRPLRGCARSGRCLRRLRHLASPRTLFMDDHFKWLCNWYEELPQGAVFKEEAMVMPRRSSPDEVAALVSLRRLLRPKETLSDTELHAEAQRVADLLANMISREPPRKRLYRNVAHALAQRPRDGAIDKYALAGHSIV